MEFAWWVVGVLLAATMAAAVWYSAVKSAYRQPVIRNESETVLALLQTNADLHNRLMAFHEEAYRRYSAHIEQIVRSTSGAPAISGPQDGLAMRRSPTRDAPLVIQPPLHGSPIADVQT